MPNLQRQAHHFNSNRAPAHNLDNMAKKKTAVIGKTNHKGKDVFTVTFPGRSKLKVADRYTRIGTAAIGAARANIEFLKAGGYLHLTYPDGRKRLAYIVNEQLTFGQFVKPKTNKSK